MAEFDFPEGGLMAGRKGLVLGVANQNSIAWGIAAQLAAQGAQLALGYMEMNEKRVKPLGEGIGVRVFAPFDVTSDASMEAAFAKVEAEFGTIDFLVHAIAYADRSQISGSFVEGATREGFAQALDISAYSFVDAARRALTASIVAGNPLSQRQVMTRFRITRAEERELRQLASSQPFDVAGAGSDPRTAPATLNGSAASG